MCFSNKYEILPLVSINNIFNQFVTSIVTNLQFNNKK